MPLVTWQEFPADGRPQDGTIREVVLPDVINLVSRRRPLMASIGARPVTNTFVEMLSDTLGTRGLNAQTEGIAAQDPTLGQPVRHFVHVQSFAEWGVVSDEEMMVGHYNEDPFSYQIRKQLDNLMNDVEHALHRQSAATGATVLARQFAGLLNAITTFASDQSGITLTEELFIDVLQQFRDANLDVLPTQAYVNTWLKRTISEFSTRVTRNVDAADRMQELIVERHTSDFGDLDILYSEDQLKSASKTTSGNSLVFIDPQYFEVGWLKPPTVEELSRDGLRRRFQINAHATLLFRNEQGGAAVTGLVPYIGQA